MEKRYDVIFWDVDGTLLDFSRSERYALTDCLKHFGLPISEEILAAYSAINNRCWRLLEKGEADRPRVLRRRFEELFDYLRVTDKDVAQFQKRYQYQLGCVFYFQDQAKELLMKLRRDFDQYIVTNGVEDTQRRKLGLSGIAELVEDIFISERIGHEKPNPLFFEGCMERIAAIKGRAPDKSRILIVGDSLTSDIRGGNAFGIDSCYYRRGAEAEQTAENGKPDYVIGNLWEVERILWQNPQIRN